MSTLDACMTWAVPVDIVTLGAHLEAYINLLPTINTLRLCHRFGTRLNAGISKLPVELVNTIEGHVVEEERSKLLEAWEKEFKCWENRCLPLDHYEERVWVETYNATSLVLETIVSIDYLNSFLFQCNSAWCDTHYDNRCAWQRRAGRPQDNESGFFAKHAKLVLKHFGLQMWISHTQLRNRLQDQGMTGGIFASTVSYLTLPKYGKFRQNLDLMYPDSDCYDDEATPYLPTQTAVATRVEVPTALSPRSLNAFHRAMKSLGLESNAKQETQTPLFVACEDGEAKHETTKPTSAHSSRHCYVKPQLMLLMKHLHVPEIEY